MAEPTLAQFRVFLVVAQKGSMSAAAVELDLTQSAVSYSVHALETQLGTTLFERRGRGVRTTGAGDRLRPLAEQLLRQFSLIVQAAPDLNAAQGTVRVAAFSSLARHLMPGLLQRLGQAHPAIRIQLDDNHNERLAVLRAVESGRADIGLTQLLSGTALSVHPLGDDPYVVLAPALWQASELWTRPYIHLGGQDDVWLTTALARTGLILRPTLNLSNEAAILALVSSGVGFTILPQLALLELPPGVVQRPLPHPVGRSYGTAVQPGPPSPAVAAVLRLLWSQET